MQYKKDITDVLRDTIASMTFFIEVLTVVDNGDGTQTITCNDIYHAQTGFTVLINGNSYVINSFSHTNESLTLLGDEPISEGDVFELYRPFFFYGTPIATNTEINQVADAFDKTPMFWLWENTKTRVLSEGSPADREVEVDLYGLTQTPERQQVMQTDDLYAECVKPMKRLFERLIKTIEEETQTYAIEDGQEYETENYAKFGVMARTKGAEKAIMFDNLSGVGCKMTLRLWEIFDCSKELPDPEPGIGLMQIGSTFQVR